MDKELQTSLKARILALLTGDTLPTLEDLCRQLEMKESDAREILSVLEQDGQIVRTRRGRYAFPSHIGLVTGTVQGNARGFAFLLPQDGSPDVFLAPTSLHGALHGDRVLCRILSGENREGEVVRVLSRRYKKLVGTYESFGKGAGYVVPDENRISADFFVAGENALHAKDRDKVVLQVLRYGSEGRFPEGKVIEVLGNENDIGTDILSIIRLHELTEEFSPEALRAAESIPDHVLPSETERREDFTGKTVFTIDGEDARDFDDAVSLENLENGHRLLGVHIADVSHYVQEGSPLDRDAYQRGTSVYLLDRVLPMLSERLSNGICSLNPGVDRLTVSCLMELDEEAEVVSYQILPSRIRSRARLTYREVSASFAQDRPLAPHLEPLWETLTAMRDLSQSLRRKREGRGSLDFDLPEPDIRLDENGIPVALERAEIGPANRLIEEFMLLANETVASFAADLSLPFCYRVHEDPDPRKIAQLRTLFRNLGIPFRSNRNSLRPMALQQVLKKLEGRKEEAMISRLILRSLAKARYAPQNLGHFGLALSNYCHFTSPIRRYPDLLVHRIIKSVYRGKMDRETLARWNARLEDACLWLSEKERAADQAERDVDDLKKAQYMAGHIGETFQGIISGVTAYGLFVELDNTAQGLIRMASLDDDHYVYEEDRFQISGVRRHKVYRLGDPVTVTVADVNLSARRIEFLPGGEED